MAVQKLFIPAKIKVGFQTRQDTFTGKLAYVIYYDEKGKLRKQASWDGWRDAEIEPLEFDNTPHNSYVLNKGMFRYSDWGSGRAVIRVHDPREFEFEISVDNLIGILMHSDVSKRDIQEECVFAWAGTELVLLPVNSEDYQASLEYTKKQDQKVSTKDLVKGRQYNKKKSDEVLTYIGFFDWYDWKEGQTNTEGESRYKWDYDYRHHVSKGKKHIFYQKQQWGNEHYFPISPSILSGEVNDTVVDDYAQLVDDFFSTDHSQKIVGAKNVKAKVKDGSYYLPVVAHFHADTNVCEILSPQHSYIQMLTQTSWYRAPRTFDFTDGLRIEYAKYPRHTGYYSQKQYDHSKDVTFEMRPIMFATANSFGLPTDSKIEAHQYLKIAKELGYGDIELILQNGRTIPYKL